MTKKLGCDVILSEDLYLQVTHDVVAEPVGKVKGKVRDQGMMVYKLLELRAV